MTQKMSKAQREAILTAHANRSNVRGISATTARIMTAAGWITDRFGVTPAGLIAAGVENIAVYIEPELPADDRDAALGRAMIEEAAAALNVDLNPGMDREDMRAWFLLRGYVPGADLEAALDQYAGATEDDLDALYDAQHGSMA